MRKLHRNLMTLAGTVALTAGVAVSTALPAAAATTAGCFNVNITIKDGSLVDGADWDHNNVVDECFAVAPNRKIWHIWPSSGGWKQMPNGGRADATLPSVTLDGNVHMAVVYVASPPSHWYTKLAPGKAWSSWQRCPANYC
jgi:hypothetical protein